MQRADPSALDFYFGEAMRLEYEFFDQQDHVPPLYTVEAVRFVGVGNACRVRAEGASDS